MNIKQKLAFLIIWAALLGTAGSAWAGYRIGESELKVRASVDEVYDDNITYAPSHTIDDLISKLALGADLAYEGKTQNLTLSGDIREELFIDNSSFNNTAGDLDARYAAELGAYDRFNLSDVFSRSEEPRSFEDAFGRTNGRYSYLQNTVTASYEHDFSSQWTARAYYANSINDASTDRVSDSLLHDAGLDVIHALSSKLALIGGYEFLNRSFSHGPDAYTNGLTGGVRYLLTEKLSLDARAGVDFIESFAGRNYDKLSLLASLTHQWDERTRFVVRFSKRFDTTTYSTDLFDQWRVTGSYEHELSRRWRMSLDAFVGEGEYISTGRTDDLYGIGGKLAYDLSEQARVSAAYRYSETDSTFNTSDYTKNVVTLSLDYAF